MSEQFSYEIPDNFLTLLIRYFQQNGGDNIAKSLQHCHIDFEDLGYAFYAGMRGDNWDKHAVDCTIEGKEESIAGLKRHEKS